MSCVCIELGADGSANNMGAVVEESQGKRNIIEHARGPVNSGWGPQNELMEKPFSGVGKSKRSADQSQPRWRFNDGDESSYVTRGRAG